MKSPIYTALYDAIHSAIESAYYDDTTTIHDYAHVATDAAMKACGPRELVWIEVASEFWRAPNGKGFYEISGGKPIYLYHMLHGVGCRLSRDAETIEAAKAAAQSHADAAHWANTLIGAEVRNG